MEEFIEKSRQLSNGAGGNKHALKEAEIFIQCARRDRPDETFALCLHILFGYGRTLAFSALKPEDMVSAQSICWICKHKKLSTEQFGSLLTAMQVLSNGCRTRYPVAVQISNAVSAAIVIAHVPVEDWLSNALPPMLELADNSVTAQKSRMLHVLSAVACIPEVAASKDVINIICDNYCGKWANTALSPHAQHIANTLHIQHAVLLESAVVDQLLAMALNIDKDETLSACVRCCTLWLECAASALESAPTECDAAVLAAWEALCVTAVHSVRLWTNSLVFRAAMTVLTTPAQEHTSNDNELDACVELLVAVCTAVTADNTTNNVTHQGNKVPVGKKHPPAAANSAAKGTSGVHSDTIQARAELEMRINREIRQIAGTATQQLLPVLSAAMATQAQRTASLYTAIVSGSRVNNIEGCINECLCVMRGNCECVTALLQHSFVEIFNVATGTAPETVDILLEQGHLWGQYLTEFAHNTRTLTDTMKFLFLCTYDETSECSDPHRQLLMLVLPVVTTLAELTTVNTGWDAVDMHPLHALRTQLVSVVQSLVESTVVAAVTAAAYTEVSQAQRSVCLNNVAGGTHSCSYSELYTPSQSLQQQEDLDDFRNNVRDCLRALVAVMPNLCTWLLRHTHEAVQGYVHAVRTQIVALFPAAASATNAMMSPHTAVVQAAGLGAGWAVAEALLHAVSAVTKPILIYTKAAAAGNTDLYNSLHTLMRLLTADDVISACRPLSRICAVLYGEFAPIMLQHGAVDVCSAMVHRLMLSLQHPEAPCSVQSNGAAISAGAPMLPACLAGLLLPTHMPMFTFTTTESSYLDGSKLMDLLCLQGCHLPFRVKQDHIGAVSLLKVITALHCTDSGSADHSAGAGDTTSMLAQLPNLLQCLKDVHTQAQGDLSYAILLFHQHQHQLLHQEGSSGHVSVHGTLLVRYSYFYLALLQAAPSKDRALSPKSFHLVFHSTLHCLLNSSSGSSANICAILVPVCVAAMHCIHAQRTQDIAHFANTMCASYGTSDATVVQAVCELSVILCTQCSLAQLLFTASAVISAVCAKYTRSPEGKELTSIMCVVDSCMPLLHALANSEESRVFTAIELEAVCVLFTACRIEYCVSCACETEVRVVAPQAVDVLQRVYASYALLLQSLLRSCGAGAEVVLLAAACLVRCLCSWYALVDVSALFQNVVREMSELGVQIMHTEQQRLGASGGKGNQHTIDAALLEEINMRTEREDSATAGRLKKPGELRSLSVLLQLWVSCLTTTELLPQMSTTAGSKSSSKGAVQQSRKLPLSALSEGTLQCIVTAVCDLFAPLGSTCERSDSGVTALSVEAWESALSVIALSLGPLHTPDTAGPSIPLDAGGCIPASAVTKALTCRDVAIGVPTLVEWYLRSGTAERMACALLFALLQSSSDSATASSTSNTLTFPSELREQCMCVFTKYVLCFGAANCTVLLTAALGLPECPCNGIVSSEEGRVGWVKRLLSYAAAGDWKKFKTTCKTLCRG